MASGLLGKLHRSIAPSVRRGLGQVHTRFPHHGAAPLQYWQQPPADSRRHTRRGKKTKTLMRHKDLPRGPIAAGAGEPEHGQQLAHPLSPEGTRSPFSPVIRQARENMDKLDGCILLTRVGGFYEMYFEQAQEYGPLLNLKVASKKTSAGPIPMAGFPFFQLDRYLKTLVQDLKYPVAIAEEFPNDPGDKTKAGGLMHSRKVARIVTPGTLIDETFIDHHASNYLLSIRVPSKTLDGPSLPDLTPPQTAVGLAWLDLSTGRFLLQSCPLPLVPAALTRICPREVVLDQAFKSSDIHQLAGMLRRDQYRLSYSPDGFRGYSPSDWENMLDSPVSKQVLMHLTDLEVNAANLLLYYVKDRLRDTSMRLQSPVRCENTHIMAIDKNTMRSLEIKQTMRDGVFRGSLLHAIKRTVTKGGARLLNEWLSSPSTSLQVISRRQNLVEAFLHTTTLRNSVTKLLKRSHDSQRLVQKFALGRGDAEDFLSLASTIDATEKMRQLIDDTAAATTWDYMSNEGRRSRPEFLDSLYSLTSRICLTGPHKLAGRIRDAIDEVGLEAQHQLEDEEAGAFLAMAEDVVIHHGNIEDAAAILPKSSRALQPQIGEGTASEKNRVRERGRALSRAENGRGSPYDDGKAWVMKPGASARLAALHADLQRLSVERDMLETNLREQLNAPSLALKWTPGLGHICHVKGKDAKLLTATKDIGEGAVVVSSSRSTRSLQMPQWTQLGFKIEQVRTLIRAEESSIFSQLRQSVIQNLVVLRRNAAVLEEIDVTAGFAELARERNFVRPTLREDISVGHNVVGGRHPTVEQGLDSQGRSFVSNDCFVGSSLGNHGQAWLITGPNMAGKSTFLRQNALLTVMAQAGCFVPAESVELAVVDAIFSRVGSADNIFHDQSTFMVEMVETAEILKNATTRSFVIMDEVGRGTSPEEGAAIAYSCLYHLVTVNKCRLLFATHFHELVDLIAAAKLDVASGGPVDMYCADVEEAKVTGNFVYVHRLRQGINRQSYALQVARLAGLPPTAIDIASRILHGKSGKHFVS